MRPPHRVPPRTARSPGHATHAPRAAHRTPRAPRTACERRWLIKIKTDSEGNVHYEKWAQPHGERTVLTKPKILCVAIEWLRIDEPRNAARRYVMSAATYSRLVDAVK